MDTTAVTPATETQDDTKASRKRLSKKVRALLAGGLVLGLGATVTLAAWNDSEFATGTFTAGTFNLQGSINGTEFTDNPSENPADLIFDIDTTNLSPNTTVSAPFAVRLSSATTSNATVTISLNAFDDVTDLSYSITEQTVFGCGSPVPNTDPMKDLTPVEDTTGVATFALSKGTPAGPLGSPPAVAGTPVFLCFAVTAGAGLDQDQTGGVTWEFAATSL